MVQRVSILEEIHLKQRQSVDKFFVKMEMNPWGCLVAAKVSLMRKMMIANLKIQMKKLKKTIQARVR